MGKSIDIRKSLLEKLVWLLKIADNDKELII
jgi:hypothetical protein